MKRPKSKPQSMAEVFAPWEQNPVAEFEAYDLREDLHPVKIFSNADGSRFWWTVYRPSGERVKGSRQFISFSRTTQKSLEASKRNAKAWLLRQPL